jgi:PAS domain S-box-containing protein
MARETDFFAAAGLGLCVLSSTGKVLFVNTALQELTGCSAQELTELPVSHVVHPDDAGMDKLLLQRLMHGQLDSYQLRARCQRKDGSCVALGCSVLAVGNSGEPPAFIIRIIWDVSTVEAPSLDGLPPLPEAAAQALESGDPGVETRLVREMLRRRKAERLESALG